MERIQRVVTLFTTPYNVTLHGKYYPEEFGGARAIVLTMDDDNDMPFGTMTVNVPGYIPPPNCVLVKTWSENTWAKDLLGQGFEDTGVRVPTGHVEAEVWKVDPDIQANLWDVA